MDRRQNTYNRQRSYGNLIAFTLPGQTGSNLQRCSLFEIVGLRVTDCSTIQTISETEALFDDDDPEIRSLASEEYKALISDSRKHMEQIFPSLIIPPSPSLSYHAILEFKSGVGGAESSLFLTELMKMYSRYSSEREWHSKVISKDDADGGGIKNATMEVLGEGVYDDLRWETGVHRVQRVPATEAGGRVHTSTVSLFVCLPTSCSSMTDI